MNSIFDLPVYKTLYKIVAPRPWNLRDQYNFPESQKERVFHFLLPSKHIESICVCAHMCVHIHTHSLFPQ